MAAHPTGIARYPSGIARFFLFVESVFLDWTGRSLVAVRMSAVLAYGLVYTFVASFCSVGVLSFDALWVLALDYWSFPCTVTG